MAELRGLSAFIEGGEFSRALAIELNKAELDLVHDIQRQMFGDEWKQNRAWSHYSPVLCPRAWRVECWLRRHRARWVNRMERVRDAWDVLRHGLPETDDW